MDAAMINQWVKGLGRTYEELVAKGVVSEQALKPLFDSNDNEELLLNPVDGA